MVCHRMNDQILLMYQVTKSLPRQWQKKVLANDIRITNLLRDVLQRVMDSGEIAAIDEKTCDLIAHNITVLGHMWTFRRWHLTRDYTIEEYIEIQTRYILGMLT